LEYSGIVACFLTWKLQSELINYSTVMCWSCPCTEEFVFTRCGSWPYYTVILLSEIANVSYYPGSFGNTWLIDSVTPNWERVMISLPNLSYCIICEVTIVFSPWHGVHFVCWHRWSGKFLQSWNCERQTVH
jgi:hypothetical protein